MVQIFETVEYTTCNLGLLHTVPEPFVESATSILTNRATAEFFEMTRGTGGVRRDCACFVRFSLVCSR
jgi:hypothetical protein